MNDCLRSSNGRSELSELVLRINCMNTEENIQMNVGTNIGEVERGAMFTRCSHLQCDQFSIFILRVSKPIA